MCGSRWIGYLLVKLRLLICVLWMLGCGPGAGANVPTIEFYWNRDNQMFHGEGDAHLTLPIGSNLKIVCPDYNHPNEYYTIYWLPEHAYTGCLKPDKGAELFVNCSQPGRSLSFTQQIVLFSGVPGGKDFKVGEHYYLTTLSTGTLHGLRNEYRGACVDFNMKLNLTISNQPIPSTQAPPAHTSSTPRVDRTTTRRRTSTATMRPTTTPKPTTTPPTTTPTQPRSPRPDIPDPTDIVIEAPDFTNKGVIQANSASTLTYTLLLSLCLSLLHILNYVTLPDILR